MVANAPIPSLDSHDSVVKINIMPLHLKIFLRIVIISIISAVIYGFFLIGSPAKQRLIKFDQQRISDLQNISFTVSSYWDYNKKLPEDLEKLTIQQDYYVYSLKDPRTGEPYEYNILGEKRYELCAIFDDNPYPYWNQSVPRPVSEEKWNYNKGRTCFQREVSPTPLKIIN